MSDQNTPMPLLALQEVGIKFLHGHTIRPAPGLLQVLWFRIESKIACSGKTPSLTFYWIEDAEGQLRALRLVDLECHPECLIPNIAEVSRSVDDDIRITEQSLARWFCRYGTPGSYLNVPPVVPNHLLLWTAIKMQILLMLERCSLPAEIVQALQGVLETDHRSMDEKYGRMWADELRSRSAHEPPPPQLPSEFLDCLSQASAFRSQLGADILGVMAILPGWLREAESLDHFNAILGWVDTQRRNRIQALHAFPWLVHEFCPLMWGNRHVFDLPTNVPEISAEIVSAIDNGDPLLPLLAARYQVKKSTLRYVRAHYNDEIPENIPPLLWLVDGMNPDKRPRTSEDITELGYMASWIYLWSLDEDRANVDLITKMLFEGGIAGAQSLVGRWCPSRNWDDFFIVDAERFVMDCGYYSGQLLVLRETDLALCGKLFLEWVKEVGAAIFFQELEQWYATKHNLEFPSENITRAPLLPTELTEASAPIATADLFQLAMRRVRRTPP